MARFGHLLVVRLIGTAPSAWRWCLAGMLLCCLLMPAGASADPLALDADEYGVSVAGHLSVLYDEAGTMTRDEAVAAADQFRPIPGNFNAGYSPKGAWWIRLRVLPKAGGGGTWYLAINAPYTDLIDVHARDIAPDGVARMTHKQTGALLPISSRDLLTHTFVVRVELTDLQEEDIFLRFSGARSLSAKPVLWRLPAFVQHLTINVLLSAVALGAAAITAVGALIFGLWLRNAAFAWYGAYVGSTALVFLSNTGFSALLLSPLSPMIVLRLQGMIGCLSIMTAAFVVRAIFCPPGRLPAVRWVLSAFGVAAALSIPVSAAGYYGLLAPFLMAGVLIMAVLVPFLAAARLMRGEPAALWYFVGFASYGIASLWFALVVFGIAPLTTFMEWGYQTVGLLHMAAIFVGLAAALRAGVRERRALQARLLSASQDNERELERSVAQRTVALENEIEARRQAEAALQVALREQRNFLVMVSHEFRTPLATVRAAIAVIERGSQDMSERLQREAGKIVRAVARLTSLIDTFLAEEWINKVAMQIERVPVDVAALAADVSREQAAQAARTIHFSGSPHAMIEGDPVLLRTVIENLVGNAIKHTDGDIRVELSPRDGGVVLAVIDSGAGIAPEEREAIFERYYRSVTAGSRPGAGIGLHIVKRVMDLHQGLITVSSSQEGGSMFEVWLPGLGARQASSEPSHSVSGA
ncbi:sensor histidine kinase [Aquabacter sp. CN5-332]|uniref:sensor histidine kinase n=1 Tax=Aquabacter sp. CN5-332 TaxID=3156608 RepID=UPI0032B5C1B2